MVELVETDDAIASCYDVMAELRPNVSRSEFLPVIRAMQADGLRLACIRADGCVVAVAGYRLSTNLFYGKHLYVDDLVTTDSERSKGYGKELLAWLRALAVRDVIVTPTRGSLAGPLAADAAMWAAAAANSLGKRWDSLGLVLSLWRRWR